MDLEHIRREYLQGGLRREDLHQDPMQQFEQWMAEAIHSGIPDPTAMTVATVDESGQPSQRIVLLKHADAKGFVFYTNLGSRKAQDLQHNNKISLHFPWYPMERQVKISGTAERLSHTEVFKYFSSRPRDSQVAAWASEQSHKISSREFLLEQFRRMKEKFADGEIPLPDFWGGFRIQPHTIEFWQGGGMRLHDRFAYTRLPGNTTEAWDIARLAP